MRTGRFLAVLFFTHLLVVLSLTQPAVASPTATADPPTISPEQATVEVTATLAEPPVKSATSVDVEAVLDVSGSMKKNDPQFLLREVVSTFASRLAPDSRLGIILFAENAEVTLGLTAADTLDFKEQVAKSLKRIEYRGRRTDIPAGVERAIYELREHGRSEAQRLIILLTDGLVDVGSPAKDLERARWLREDLALQAKRLGIRIFGIALTEGADFQLMQSVAETTGGEYFRVLAAADIPGTFEKISTRIEELTRVAKQTTEAKPLETPTSQAPLSPVEPAPVVVQVPVSTTGWQQPWVLPTVVGLIVLGIVALTATRGAKRATAKVDVPPATLHDRSGQSGADKYSIKKPVTKIGRDAKTNDVVILQDTVSSQHAAIEFRDGAFCLRDLRSTNGTFVNGKKFSDPETIREVPLKSGDRIRFDAYEFEFVLDALEGAKQTVVAGAVPAGRTRLRSEPPSPQIREPEAPSPQPTIPKPIEAGRGAGGGPAPAEVTPAAGNGEAKTKLKTDKCPIHESLKATELCSVCGTAYCKTFCMKEKDGQVFCPKGHLQQ